MKHTLTGLMALAVAALFTNCETTSTGGSPKTAQEKTAEVRQGKTSPDPLRDPRPNMPPTGPMFQPMR